MIEPYQNEIENELQEFLSGKLRTAIKYSEDGIKGESDRRRSTDGYRGRNAAASPAIRSLRGDFR